MLSRHRVAAQDSPANSTELFCGQTSMRFRLAPANRFPIWLPIAKWSAAPDTSPWHAESITWCNY